MKEKAPKDRKILKDKKVTIKSSICYFFAAVCFLISGCLHGGTSGLALAAPACLFLVLGFDARKKEKNGEMPDTEDQETPQK